VRLGNASLAREAFGQPERASEEHALAAFDPVVGAIAENQPVAVELPPHRFRGVHHERIGPRHEGDVRQQQQRGVDLSPAEALDEDATRAIASSTISTRKLQ
jgi:hypothetical protein